MRRLLLGLALLLAAALALPPLWFRIFPAEVPPLAPAERMVRLASGLSMHAIERGMGPPVVLVHGHPGQAADFRELIPRLAARGRHVIAVDRMGWGHSDARPSPDDFTLAGNAQDLLQLLAALDLEDTTVVGFSYGGGTVLTAAHRDPSRMGRVVLIGSVGPGVELRAPAPVVGALFWGALRWVHAVPPLEREIQRLGSAAAFSRQPEPDWWLPALAANLAQEKSIAAFRNEGEKLRDPSSSQGLSLPILVIYGDQDLLVPIEVGRELAARAERAELLEVPGGSHMLPVTHAELLAERIAAFSAPAAPPSPSPAPGGDEPPGIADPRDGLLPERDSALALAS